MLQFKQSDTTAVLILTLTENVTLTDPYYLFVFTHVLTKQTVKFIISNGGDQSTWQTRYNQFTINPSTAFLNKPVGMWHYVVYEQASFDNTDVTLTGGALEYGKLILNRATAFEFIKYNEPTTYSTYNG